VIELREKWRRVGGKIDTFTNYDPQLSKDIKVEIRLPKGKRPMAIIVRLGGGDEA
jgi:hypothetical protein